MSNIIRNGNFTEGLTHWKANRTVEVGTHQQINYAHLTPDTFISQEFGSVEGGIVWQFKLDTAVLPLVGVPDRLTSEPVAQGAKPLQKLVGEKTKAKPSMPTRTEDDYSGFMFLSMSDGEFHWWWNRDIPDYPWWGMTGFLLEVPAGVKSGEIVIMLPRSNNPLETDKAITKVELLKY